LTWRGLETFLREGGAPVLDPTDEGELEIELTGYYASSLLYRSSDSSYRIKISFR
jgi:hypothetical protein